MRKKKIAKFCIFISLASALLLPLFKISANSVPLDEAASVGKRYISVGHPGIDQKTKIGLQFTDSEYEYIARHHSVMMFAKFHAGGQMEKHHEAAAELKRRNSNIKIFPYLGSTYWFPINKFGDHYDSNAERWVLKDEWYLKDTGGNKIVQALDQTCTSNNDPDCTYYIDVSKAEYRNWAVNQISGWMAEKDGNGNSIYDGIHMDNAIILNVDGCFNNAEKDCNKINMLIEKLGGGETGKAAIKNWNEGLKSLIREIKLSLRGKQVIFNGVTIRPLNLGNSLDHFNYADMAINEDFCFDVGLLDSKEKILASVNLMLSEAYPGKIFLEKSNIITAIDGNPMTNEEKQRMRRLSYGSFLLGYRPGYTFYKEAEDGFYGVDGNVDIDPSEININFGNPAVNDSNLYHRVGDSGDLYFRRFQNGRVYVNLGDTDRKITAIDNYTLMNGGAVGAQITEGSILPIPPKDAVFLILTNKFSCSDGTLYNQCSQSKPKFCENGTLVDRCAQCGCASGTCLSDGTCQDVDISPPGAPAGLTVK